ncbi:Disease resistance protein [Macleaya cordata]|uniref:Disease resistance protein n=1 Tax=Macleaya cordata TaxID=56857 RepID=A0A200PUC6_MACCD|nr:Disease resistance protein [Macleaya cordata]
MAEGIVSFAVERLTDLLVQEAAFLYNVRDQVEQLRDQLKWMQAFLKDADTKQEVDQRIRQWVSEIRDIAYDAEDVIDKYILEIEEEKMRKIRPRRGLMSAFKNYTTTCICNKGIVLHKIGNKIEEILKRLEGISAKLVTFGIKDLGEVGVGSNSSSSRERLRNLRRVCSYGDEVDFTGLNDTVKELVTQLTGNGLRRRCVISIVGMGGQGKTSLAKKIYNHTAIESHFHRRAWVYVSQKYNTVDLLRKILKSCILSQPFKKKDLERMEKSTEEDLEKWLFNGLKEERYLVVLDDVWDQEAWEGLKRAFPDKNKGSRVLLTTRNRVIASSADQTSHLHQLRFLTEEESWVLFCKKAFPNNGDDIMFCPPNLEELGRKMVEKCGGLPLGIVILGGLLSKQHPPSANEWQRVLDRISQNLMKDGGQISEILSLSYNDLPYHLKICFLHVGLFPEDYVIDTERLIQQWVAEGFIPQGREEDVAEDYLNELIDRSMIQVETASRRLTIHSEINRFVSVNHFPYPPLRSLVVFNLNRETIQLKQLRFIFTGFKLLKVLDLDDVRSSYPSSMLDSFGEMINLRYLGLRGIHLKDLPASIGNLHRLQTLKIGECKVPNVIFKMKQLRHVQGYWLYETMRHLKIDTLTNLQTLDLIRDDALIENDNLANLTNLRELTIAISDSNTDALCASLSRLCSLRYLNVCGTTSRQDPPIVLQSLQCSHLLALRLWIPVERLPNNLHESSPNLTYLILDGCELKDDPMATLERLPNLLELSIKNSAYMGRDFTCLANGFPRLESLGIDDLYNLEEWRVEEGAMPRLKTLTIQSCRQLKKVPEGLKFITTLCKLEFIWMPKEFEDRVRGGGEDSYIVQHVPSVTFLNTAD